MNSPAAKLSFKKLSAPKTRHQRGSVRFFVVACLIANVANAMSTIANAQIATESARNRQANIILLVADDLGYGELGCQGNPEIPTPHIDALAESGVRLTQAYVTAPNCSPSRAGMFTGRFPTRFGYEFNPIGARNEDPGTGLPRTQQMLAEALKAAGYTTGLIGKWHLGGTADYHPIRRGFGEFFGFTHEGHYFSPPPWTGTTLMLRRKFLPTGSGTRHQVSPTLIYSSHMGHDEPAYDANNPIVRGGQPVVENEYLTDALTREAVSFIDRNQATPFFLALTYNAVHSPLQAKNETLKKFSYIEDVHRRIFAAMLSDLDSSVGAVVAAVDRNQLSSDTLVIFLSDNGGPTKELTSSNLPLRSGKGSMYEGGLRVPFIVRWPGTLPAGEVCTEIASSLDIFPTCLKIAGTESPKNLDGYDLIPLLSNPDAKSMHQKLYWRQGGRAALRHGSWKIVAPGRNANDRRWELYNIDSDIGESNNRAAEYPDMLSRLVEQWNALDAEMQDSLF